MYGAVSAKVAEEMRKPDVSDFFAKLIQRTSPKSYAQAMGEHVVTRRFFENFSGDQVRRSTGGAGSGPGGEKKRRWLGRHGLGVLKPYGDRMHLDNGLASVAGQHKRSAEAHKSLRTDPPTPVVPVTFVGSLPGSWL
jgi:hypothetical protein